MTSSNLVGYQLDNMDLSEYDLDGPLPDIPDHVAALASQTSMRNIVRWGREEGLTIRQIYERFAGARGQRTLIGSPVDIADDMEKWFRGRRFPCAPAISAGRARRFCRSGNPGTTEPWAVPRRIRGRDVARKHGPEPAAEPLHDRCHLTTNRSQNSRSTSRNVLPP